MFEVAISRYLKHHGHSDIRLKAVLFDMDGVLFNSMPYHADAWHKVMERRGLHLSREEAYMHEGRTGAATINIVYQRQYGQDATPELIESIYAEKSAEFNKHPEPGRMPEPYLMGLEKAGIKANEALVVEKAPIGVQAGVAAGIFTIAVNTGPLDAQVLLDAGANLLFPSMQALNENWEKLQQALIP